MHTCPNCSCTCHCNGDIDDDLFLPDPTAEAKCVCCLTNQDFIAFDDADNEDYFADDDNDDWVNIMAESEQWFTDNDPLYAEDNTAFEPGDDDLPF